MLKQRIPGLPHLLWWREESESLIYCSKRFSLVHADRLLTSWFEELTDHSLQQPIDLYQATFQLPEQIRQVARHLLDSTIAWDLEEEKEVTPPHIWTVPFSSDIEPLRISVGGLSVALYCQDVEIMAILKELLIPISQSQTTDKLLSTQSWYLIKESDSWSIGDFHQRWYQQLTDEQVIPLLVDQLQQRSYQQSGYQLAFHGAAVRYIEPESRQAYDILIPGSSGCGKTTLALALCLQGARAYTDESITLDKKWKLHPIPVPFAIKQGSWKLLAEWGSKDNKEINDTVFERRDGRRLRYWWPPKPFMAEPATMAKTIILLPQYLADQETLLRPASLIDTTQSMALGGYQQENTQDPNVIPSYIDWLNQVSRLHINYANANEAVKLLFKHLASHND